MSDLDTAFIHSGYPVDAYEGSATHQYSGRQERDSANSIDQSGLRLEFDGANPAPAVRRPGHGVQLMLKRVFDVLASSFALVVLLPFLIIVAILIKATSPGSVFFRQEREGLDGRLFRVLKFRSMRNEFSDYSGVSQTVENDPRVTAIGRLIRKTSFDELPQLLNVLKGDMSLVGPRPHVVGMMAGGTTYKNLVPYYDQRLKVLPGLTGWAQANGLRGPTDNAYRARARVNHDIAYIQNFSLWLDVKIVFMTLCHEFFGGSGD